MIAEFKEIQISILTIINPLLIIGAIIGILITHQLNKINKGVYFSGLTVMVACILFSKAMKYVDCLKLATKNLACEGNKAIIWIAVFDLFIIAIITVIYNIIETFFIDKEKEKSKSTIVKEKEEFIKDPNANLNIQPKIVLKEKRACPKCKTLNAINANRCFICGTIIDNTSKNEAKNKY